MSISAAETDALICAFRLAPSAALGPEPLDLVPIVEEPLWLHFNLLDNRARRYLKQQVSIDDDARAILLGTETRIQSLVVGEAFTAVRGDLHHDFNIDPEGFGTLNVYVAPHLLTCVRSRDNRTTNR